MVDFQVIVTNANPTLKKWKLKQELDEVSLWCGRTYVIKQKIPTVFCRIR